MRKNSRGGFTIAESMLAIALVALAMGFLGMLFQRSYEILRVIDEKERGRQAARMGFDRLSSELREATEILDLGSVARFEKIDPTTSAATPFPAPTNPPEDYVPPDWTPMHSYDNSKRLIVEYVTEEESLYRLVRYKNGGQTSKQLVVVGVNSFTCSEVASNQGEIEISLSVLDRGRIQNVKGRVLCPCIKEAFRAN